MSSFQEMFDHFVASNALPLEPYQPTQKVVHLCDLKHFLRALEMSMDNGQLLWTDALQESLAYLVGTEGHALHRGESDVKALCEGLWDVQEGTLRSITEEWKEKIRASWY